MVDLRPAVGGEGELADLIGAALGLQLLLGFADAGQFRFGVDHVGNQLVVDLAGLADDLLDAGHGFILGLVREHRPGRHVANYPDTGGFGAMPLVGEHAAFIRGEANVLQPQALCIRSASDGYQHIIGLQHFGGATCGGFDAELHAGSRGGGAGHFRTQLEADALLAQGTLQGFACFAVDARTDPVEEFDHRHLRAQAPPHRAQLQPDHARADHHQMLWHFCQ
ncbi:hypothetical protein D3C87_982990 [compost metagenome]